MADCCHHYHHDQHHSEAHDYVHVLTNVSIYLTPLNITCKIMHVLHPLLRQNKVYIHSFPVAQFIFQPLAILLIDVQNSEFAMYDLTEMILF